MRIPVGKASIAVCAVTALAAGGWAWIGYRPSISASPVSASPVSVLKPAERDILAQMRAAGLRGDRSQTTAMIKALQNGHPTYIATGLRALAEVGDETALPAIEKLMLQHPTDTVGEEARAVRARLISVNRTSKALVPDENAKTKLRIFLSEVRLKPAELSSSVSEFGFTQRGRQGWSREAYAMEEIADMMYRDPFTNYQTVPDLQGVDFTADPGSALKARLAQFPKAERVEWMINELAHKRSIRGEDGFLLQLTVDEGSSASHLAARKLMEMDAHRSDYTYIGFSALFDVLRGVGDTSQSPIVERFLHDKDGWIAYYAQQVYPDVRRGLRRQYAVGY